MVKQGVDLLLSKVPDAIAHFGLGPDELARIIQGKIGILQATARLRRPRREFHCRHSGGAVQRLLQVMVRRARNCGFARRSRRDARKRAGAAEAANETQQAIAETADARANLPPAPDSPADLARRMRERQQQIAPPVAAIGRRPQRLTRAASRSGARSPRFAPAS